MEVFFLKIAIVFTFALFVVPKRFLFYFVLFLQIIIITTTSIWAIQSLFTNNFIANVTLINFLGNPLNIVVDKLSAFFILIINFTTFTGLLYSKGYLKTYTEQKNKTEISFHYFNYIWLHISMLLVTMFRDAFAFLFIWEIMSLASFFLVIFDSDKKETIKIGIKYLIQMHIGVLFLLIAFLYVFIKTNGVFSFEALNEYFYANNPLVIFILFFIGFGIKAGFIPLHSWLPHAHPSAPSHVSGVMSGVMIKLGIYGILRVLTYIHHDLLDIGLFILFVSLFSGIMGVSMAIVQHDIKKLLAYHSIENIGIIGIGIGLGVIGIAVKMPILAVLGFAGGILHILNHSLFKSLLFFTSGSVYKQTHTRNIEQLGGLIKKMPKTAIFFLLGAIAICGLPPFNGFISEFLIYSGMFKSLQAGNLLTNIVILFTFSGLAIIGGLAIFCFTKVFSIIFLGNPRSEKVEQVTEVETSMLIPYFLIGFLIIFIGLVPSLFMRPLSSIVDLFTLNSYNVLEIIPTFNKISISSGIFILIILVIWTLRAIHQKKHLKRENTTWACGYTGANPALHQYTASSFSENYRELSSKLVNVKKEFVEFEANEIFPSEKEFETHSSDIFEDNLITKPTNKLLIFIEKIAIFQSGKIQHYLLYSIIFIVIISLLTILKWI